MNRRVLIGLTVASVGGGALVAEVGAIATVSLLGLLAGIVIASTSVRLARPRRSDRAGWLRPRCASCGRAQRAGVRLLAGPHAYVCEPCVRRFQDLLDTPDEITRIL